MVSLGCARNLVDSEKMVQDLQEIGLSLVAEGSNEKIRLLNTCSFIQAAIDETEVNISQLTQEKQSGKLDYIVVTGCYPSRFKRPELEEKFPDVDLWISTKELDKFQSAMRDMVFKKKYQPEVLSPYTKLTPSHFAYLKISEGCNNWCSFCTIPKIRGAHKSKSIETLLQEAKQQLSMGVQELILIAEDTTCWGEDLYGKPSFPLLLEELSKLPVKWIRPMYIFPSRVDDALIRVIKNTPNITNYIDMPIQHVNSDLLKAMNRQHDKDFLKKILQDMKTEIPDLAIRSTFILGFPGETEAHVKELCDFIEEVPFDHIGCFTYSEERETRSARFSDKVAPETAKKWADQVMNKQYKLVQKYNKTHIGSVLECVYEGNGLARSFREAPDVDNAIVVESTKPLVPGQFYTVKLTGQNTYDLLGTVL